MDQKSKPKFQMGEWIEKYRFWIGGGLLFLIMAGVGFQLYRENYAKPNYEERIMNQEERIKAFEEKISKLQVPSPNNQTAQMEQGAVAGATNNSAIVQPNNEAAASKNHVVGKININTASASELDALPGIGAVYSQRIVDYRNANGGFKSIDEIKNVKGIGDKTFEKFREQITI